MMLNTRRGPNTIQSPLGTRRALVPVWENICYMIGLGAADVPMVADQLRVGLSTSKPWRGAASPGPPAPAEAPRWRGGSRVRGGGGARKVFIGGPLLLSTKFFRAARRGPHRLRSVIVRATACSDFRDSIAFAVGDLERPLRPMCLRSAPSLRPARHPACRHAAAPCRRGAQLWRG